MPLILTLRTDEEFFANEQRFVLDSVLSPHAARLLRTADGAIFDLSDTRSVEILPDVLASLGTRGQFHLARIAIEAPRSIHIHRGQAKR